MLFRFLSRRKFIGGVAATGVGFYLGIPPVFAKRNGSTIQVVNEPLLDWTAWEQFRTTVKHPCLTIKTENLNYARENIKQLIANGSDAIDEIIKIAKAGDNPRAFEVVSLLLKTVADMNKDLIDLYQKTKVVKKEETTINNTTNQSIFVGSTSQLQDLINKDRSRIKSIKSQQFLENDQNGI